MQRLFLNKPVNLGLGVHERLSTFSGVVYAASVHMTMPNFFLRKGALHFSSSLLFSLPPFAKVQSSPQRCPAKALRAMPRHGVCLLLQYLGVFLLLQYLLQSCSRVRGGGGELMDF